MNFTKLHLHITFLLKLIIDLSVLLPFAASELVGPLTVMSCSSGTGLNGSSKDQSTFRELSLNFDEDTITMFNMFNRRVLNCCL